MYEYDWTPLLSTVAYRTPARYVANFHCLVISSDTAKAAGEKISDTAGYVTGNVTGNAVGHVTGQMTCQTAATETCPQPG